ncbi:3-deoxy-manno-octulosonate cytidylyltransferase [Pontibacter sp. G13]|uniref:3-deoxy-manno-octulosonate cytidylyltransferase n=1 Tax=Pontibacter sp. G13 TaxID=3074898 RepID=UPI00288901B9|nr:3-deoxy-manno-octulosonate cytidylyltransferase [Pontibacter sp. G13]WNJ16753.1 3-deoxy-manno-octulosonate cytidylyltransferase [Pontibacter sp. G13]
MKKLLGVIPARYASTRFPGKPLVEIQGVSMIQRVYTQCQQAEELDEVVVATDDERIFEHVQSFGGQVEMTREAHPSGTDRVAEVAARRADFDWVINIQGDEPFLDPEQVNLLARMVKTHGGIGTLVRPLTEVERLNDPNTVKVVRSVSGAALYFSRAAIPFVRGRNLEDWLTQQDYFEHIGLYGFERKVLLELTHLDKTQLEQSESLEQLRWLAHGYPIQTAISNHRSISIDTPDDLKRVSSGF